jgi:hypothetical protein
MPKPQGLPPGLDNRDGDLPPGLQMQLDDGGVLPGGLAGEPDLDAFIVNSTNLGFEDQVLLNDGSGDFDLGTSPEGGISGTSTALGDLDGDGDLDAFVTDAVGASNRVLINQGFNSGDFDFGTAPEAAVDSDGQPGASTDVALGDLDGDGDLDAFIANASHDIGAQVLINQGFNSGDFDLGTTPEGSGDNGLNGATSVALGDLDGDGDLDAFVGSAFEANQVLINLDGNGDGNGDFFLGNTPEGGNQNTQEVALGDLDGDGDLDAFLANVGDNQVLINQGLNSGDLDLSTTPPEGGAQASTSIALGDLDGDGDLDAFVTNGGAENQVLINQGLNSGVFVLGTTPEGGAQDSTFVALGDLDGDGTIAAVDENGLPNIDPNGLLPDMYVDTIV